MSTPTNFKSSGGFDAANQKVTTLADATNPQDALNLRTFDVKNTVQPYNQAKTYNPDFIIEYAGQLWKCIGITSGQFDKTKWTAICGTEKWIRITGAYTASPMDTLYVDTSATPLTITLPPTPKSGDYVRFLDAGNADKNAITIASNGSTINGAAGNSTIVRANSQLTAIYLGGTWVTTLDLLINRVRFLTASDTLVANVMYTLLANASFNVTLPSNPKTGDWVALTDQLGTVGSNPITVLASDKQINGQNSFVINQKKASWQLIYDGAGWITYALTGDALLAVKNLSELTDKPQARLNLGLGSIATYDTGTATGQVRLNGQNDLVYQERALVLTNLSQLVLAANKLIYATGANTFATTDFTAVARALLAATTDVEQRAVLQLGTAATKNVGTAAGNLMQVGAFGLGGTPGMVADMNQISGTQFFITGPDTVNDPAGFVGSAKQGYGFQISHSSSSWRMQQWTNTVDLRTFQRICTTNPSDVWGAWTELLKTSDVGTAAYRNVGTAISNLAEVGAFGWGQLSTDVILPDFDAITPSGMYSIRTGLSVGTWPIALGDGVGASLLVTGYRSLPGSPNNFIEQRLMYTKIGTPLVRIFIRRYGQTAWEAWSEILTTANTGNALYRDVGVAAGNLMEVGSFGIGNDGTTILTNLDDGTLKAGIYSVGVSTTGVKPVTSTGLTVGNATVVIAKPTSTTATQTIMNAGGLYMFTRSWSGSAWSAWNEILTQYNMYPIWTDVTFQSGWVNFDAVNYHGVQYRKEGNRVWFRGVASNPTTSTSGGSQICTMPVGFRPKKTKVIAVSINPTGSTTITSNSYLAVNDVGMVTLGVYATANFPLLLDNISFEID